MLEETPWVREAQQESEARRNVGILFDDNRLNEETGRDAAQAGGDAGGGRCLAVVPGRPAERLHHAVHHHRIRPPAASGRGHRRGPAVRSLTRLDAWIDETYREILARGKADENHLSSTIALYLYGRSFFLDDLPIAPEHKEANRLLPGAGPQVLDETGDAGNRRATWRSALKRFGDKQTPQDIMKSLKERSVTNEELGMFWRDTELSWWWYHAPIETQAVMIEAFDEVMNDAESVEDCRVWLLKQKQTQDWKTTKATADAVYSLLLRGTDMLASDALVQVSRSAI